MIFLLRIESDLRFLFWRYLGPELQRLLLVLIRYSNLIQVIVCIQRFNRRVLKLISVSSFVETFPGNVAVTSIFHSILQCNSRWIFAFSKWIVACWIWSSFLFLWKPLIALCLIQVILKLRNEITFSENKSAMAGFRQFFLHQVITFRISILLLILRCDFQIVAGACCNASHETNLLCEAHDYKWLSLGQTDIRCINTIPPCIDFLVRYIVIVFVRLICLRVFIPYIISARYTSMQLCCILYFIAFTL